MRLEDITPEWVRARMAAEGITQVQLAAEIGLTQDKLSKSLTGKRNFTVRELDALGRLLCEPPAEDAPSDAVLDLARRIGNLPEASFRVLQASVEAFEREAAQGQTEHSEQRPDDEA